MDESKAESNQAFAPFIRWDLGVSWEHPAATSEYRKWQWGIYSGKASHFSDHGPVLTLGDLEGSQSSHAPRGRTGWLMRKPLGEHPGVLHRGCHDPTVKGCRAHGLGHPVPVRTNAGPCQQLRRMSG